ncbi:MAG: hypothetical protein BGN88_04780 [Clostridiales bacterium 43-6]|nr:MAG: hypothetical protein BGN88_04780 [Clostridiales bacterium 43-6]
MHTNDQANQFVQNTYKVIPQPKPDAKQITRLIKSRGKVTGYELSDGQRLSKQQAIATAKDGGIAGVGVAERKGSEYLRTLPDGNEGNNLSNLPSITE